MSQNIYDNTVFFEGYSKLPRSSGGLAEAPEWPTVRSLLPRIEGAHILDLGCGFGAFDRWAVEQGAAAVVGLDLSEKMLAEARARTATDRVRYLQGDLASLEIDAEDFDLIYSALVFHYIEDFGALCAGMRRYLRLGGSLVATVEHPLYTAPSNLSWAEQPDGTVVWPLDRYFEEGRRVRTWFTDGVVKYHRTITSYLQGLLENHFAIRQLVEWVPSREQLVQHPEWSNEIHRPMFLLFRADAV